MPCLLSSGLLPVLSKDQTDRSKSSREPNNIVYSLKEHRKECRMGSTGENKDSQAKCLYHICSRLGIDDTFKVLRIVLDIQKILPIIYLLSLCFYLLCFFIICKEKKKEKRMICGNSQRYYFYVKINYSKSH